MRKTGKEMLSFIIVWIAGISAGTMIFKMSLNMTMAIMTFAASLASIIAIRKDNYTDKSV